MSKYVVNLDCLRTDIDDESIILNTSTGKYLRLNSTSKFILDCINDNLYESEIIKKINTHYKTNELKARSSLEAFVKIAVEKNIIFIDKK